MKSRCFVLCSLILALTAGCQDDDHPCDMARQGADYVISDTARAFLAPYDGAVQAIFRNQAGEEIPFAIHPLRDTTVGYQVAEPCPADPMRIQTVAGTSQLLTFSFANPAALPDPIYLTLYEFPRPDTSVALEAFSISVTELLSGDYEAGDEVFYWVLGADNPQLRQLDSLVIGDKTFYEVFEMQNLAPAPKYTIRYTLTEGIVHIVEPLSGAMYIYERTE